MLLTVLTPVHDGISAITFKPGGEPIYYHGPDKLCVIAGGPQNQLILSQNSTFI